VALAEALAVNRRTVALDSANRDWQQTLSKCLDRIARLEAANGRPAEARANFEEALLIDRRLAALAPTDEACLRNLLISLTRVADLNRDQHRYEEAEHGYVELLRVSRRLATLVPNRHDWIYHSLRSGGAIAIMRARTSLAFARRRAHSITSFLRRS
jgi:tetratricopeptide (TPR) repeat protein